LRYNLRITITGEPDSLTVGSGTYPCGNDVGEVDFAVYPTISHGPMALCTVERLLVFTLSDGCDYTLPEKGVKQSAGGEPGFSKPERGQVGVENVVRAGIPER
jgi:hypothetical protein